MEKKIVKTEKTQEVYARSCQYDPHRDIQKVEPGLAVNIDDMLQTGIVKDSGETLDNNGIDDPNLIIGRIRDTFDAIDAARIIKKYGKKNPGKVVDAVNDAVQNSSSNPNE